MAKYELDIPAQKFVLSEQLQELKKAIFREELHKREALAAIEKAKPAAKINPKMQTYLTEKEQVVNSSNFMISEAKDKVDVILDFMAELDAKDKTSSSTAQ